MNLESQLLQNPEEEEICMYADNNTLVPINTNRCLLQTSENAALKINTVCTLLSPIYHQREETNIFLVRSHNEQTYETLFLTMAQQQHDGIDNSPTPMKTSAEQNIV